MSGEDRPNASPADDHPPAPRPPSPPAPRAEGMQTLPFAEDQRNVIRLEIPGPMRIKGRKPSS